MVKEIQIEFTDKQVTAWSGMRLMKDMLDNIGIKEFMNRLELPHKGSNQGYDPMQIIECFGTSIWIIKISLLLCSNKKGRKIKKKKGAKKFTDLKKQTA